jgi:hypothetical protein
MSTVRVTQKGSSGDDLEHGHRSLAERAYDLFLRRGASGGDELMDWFAAEREIIRRAAVDFLENDGAFTFRYRLPATSVRRRSAESACHTRR